MNNKQQQIPALIAGPIVRHVAQAQINFWLVTRAKCPIILQLFEHSGSELCAEQTTPLIELSLNSKQLQQIPIGESAVINLVSVDLPQPLNSQVVYQYNFIFHGLISDENGEPISADLTKLHSKIAYENEPLPNFVINPNIKQMLHGSCRKPHHDSGDALVQVDKLLESCHRAHSPNDRPSMLMMSGDQVYVDDVAGPMLSAIHQVIQLLGLYDETFDDEVITDSQALYQSPHTFYQRKQILPHTKAVQGTISQFFAASKKPIFTSDHGKNHLASLAEIFAMYLLVWSPNLWPNIRDKIQVVPAALDEAHRQQYLLELSAINDFISGLPDVARALAHMPTYMIFDDHDITDDWNLTRGWEEAAYNNPFAKRIIGNALIGYWLCQGWGNTPGTFTEITEQHEKFFSVDGYLQQDDLIEQLHDWHDWHFTLATSPKIVVLDTRTQRWRSESNANKPSGLMDWEALCEMQQQLFNQEKVILVSAAPIYGVKMIETIQKFVTFIGFPLRVDAENWMAHSGTANVMLNIFRHYKTPPNFIILSGDVHYSFFYEITHRFKRNSSRIFQITASGLKNQFPTKILKPLEQLNSVLYGRYSPLNWFTKRRRMRVQVRKPSDGQLNSLTNTCGVGLITLTDDQDVVRAELLTVEGKVIEFVPKNED